MPGDMPAPWSYSFNPASSPKDQVRFLIGDTNACDPLLFDGEITYLLGLNNDTALNAAIEGCEVIAAKFSRLVDETVGSVSLSFSQRAEQYRQQAATLTRRLALTNCSPIAGGISINSKMLQERDTDRVRPKFTKNMLQCGCAGAYMLSAVSNRIIDVG